MLLSVPSAVAGRLQDCRPPVYYVCVCGNNLFPAGGSHDRRARTYLAGGSRGGWGGDWRAVEGGGREVLGGDVQCIAGGAAVLICNQVCRYRHPHTTPPCVSEIARDACWWRSGPPWRHSGPQDAARRAPMYPWRCERRRFRRHRAHARRQKGSTSRVHRHSTRHEEPRGQLTGQMPLYSRRISSERRLAIANASESSPDIAAPTVHTVPQPAPTALCQPSPAHPAARTVRPPWHIMWSSVCHPLRSCPYQRCTLMQSTLPPCY